MRPLVYYVATSIDGYIADAAGNFDFFPADLETLAALFARYPETCPAHVRGPLGITADPARFDAVIMGAATHRPALDAGLTSAYPHLDQYVVTHRELPPDPTVTVINSDVQGFVRELKSRPGRDIWLAGGGNLAGQLLDQIDEVQLKVNPVLLGNGIPLIGPTFDVRQLDLVNSDALPGGVLLNTYRLTDKNA